MARPMPWKLLIVDDHAPMRATLRALLASGADEIHEAADGAAAVAQFVAQRPDWVIMDLRMRPVNGLVATGEIRRHDPAARVVIITQQDDPDLRTAAVAAGACAFIPKDDLQALTHLLAAEPEVTAAAAPTHFVT